MPLSVQLELQAVPASGLGVLVLYLAQHLDDPAERLGHPLAGGARRPSTRCSGRSTCELSAVSRRVEADGRVQPQRGGDLRTERRLVRRSRNRPGVRA